MTYRYSLLSLCITSLLLACGGETAHNGSGGSGGSPPAAGGQINHGGSTSGGNTSGGSGGCCAAAAICPMAEREVQESQCPGNTSCHQVSICCSSIWCVADDASGGAGGSDDASGGAGGSDGEATHDCNGTTCTATQACVAYRTVGGVLVMPDDAGTCPSGKHVEGNSCQADFAYKCADLQGACQNQGVSCACAQPPASSTGVCPVGFGSCSQPGTAVDASTQLVCQQLAP